MKLTAKEYIEIEDRYGAHNYHPLDVVISRASGVWVEDVDGNRYMDFLAAYSAVNQGHCHPRIISVLKDQADRLTLTSRAFRNDQWPMLAREACELLGYEMILPMNTGAEAVETAIKAVRRWGYQVKGIPSDRAEIIACANNFHGRTTTIVSFSTEPSYRENFGPLTPGFKIIPYNDSQALEKAISPHTAAFMVEPIQGEGGVDVPDEGYLKKCFDTCRTHNVLFVADEIQSGLGRTGKMMACDHEGIKPDMVIIGKALSGGTVPVSAVLASKEILGVFKPGDHGSTYGGAPLGAAVARESLRVLVEEKLVEKSAELGEYLMGELRKINSPHVEKYRGKGLWIGIVLKQSAGGARRFCEALMQEGLLCKETHVNIIRLAPPLVITRDELDWALDKIRNVLTRL
ncbi:ornithine--oxo-acid transaminase [bacterium]|nr:ornithine--oxo-acid transaminase [candidate division CSSED10-310 bacterium]